MVSQVEAHIVSHFRQDRERQLSLVLDAMLGWRSCLGRVVITSNTPQYEASGFLAAYAERFSSQGRQLTLNVAGNLSNPRMLTWEHKKFIKPWIESASPGEDYFLYIEDDIVITDANVSYFIHNLRALKPSRLIPGFIRYETKGEEKRLVDVMSPEYWQRDRSTRIGGQVYHANKNPYWAGFMLDRELAEEYVSSRSFSPETSSFVPWNIQERSAMGLTFESPPKALRSRVVIPIVDGAPDPGSLVWHCSNNYSAEDHPIVAQLTIERAYQREAPMAYLVRKTGAALNRLQGKASARS